MTTHSSPLASADPPVEEAEPNRRTSRFDQRGIALQTVIIMVVMLAIAGAVAAVLLSRGSETTAQLEQQGVTAVVANRIESEALCTATSGVQWHGSPPQCKYNNTAACNAAGGTDSNGATTAGNCKDQGGNLMGLIVA